jgi:hypothetical protein
MNNLCPGNLAYLPPDYVSTVAQRQLSLAYQMGNYNPLTHDIDAKLLEARIKQNQVKHKMQDMMLFTKRLE